MQMNKYVYVYIYIYMNRDRHTHPHPQPNGSLSPCGLGGVSQQQQSYMGTV